MWKKVLLAVVALIAVGVGIAAYTAISSSASDNGGAQLAINACQEQLRIPARLHAAGKYKGMVIQEDMSKPMHAELVEERNMHWTAQEGDPLTEDDKLRGTKWVGQVYLWVGTHQRLMSDGHWETVNGPETAYAGCYVRLFSGAGPGLSKWVDGGSRIRAGIYTFDLNWKSFQ